jgi:hypothetical protein
MVVPFAVDGGSFRADKPQVWADARFIARPRPPSRDLDLHPDGDRFVMGVADQRTDGSQDKITFVFNFLDELRRIAPATKR